VACTTLKSLKGFPMPNPILVKIARYGIVVGALMGIWLVLSGLFETKYVLIGLVGSLVIAADTFPWGGQKPFPIFRFLWFLPWHFKQVVLSNFHVARLVWSPRLVIRPRFIRVAPGLTDERGLTELGCAVNLTPGTLTVDLDTETMLVHALDVASATDLENHIMEDHVAKIFR
jgi:multicomponent Na+:H+ antiporter subunit E